MSASYETRVALENAVWQALEEGDSPEEVKELVESAIDDFEEDA